VRKAKGEVASRRILLRPSTWERLWRNRRPGETFSDAVDRLLEAQNHE